MIDNGYNAQIVSEGGLLMRDTMTMTAALPVEVRRRPRKSARRAVRRRCLLQVAAAIAAVLIAAGMWLNLDLDVEAGGCPVTLIYQNPELPNGCEVTSLAMVLASAGCPVDKLELYQDYLPKADFSLIDGKRYGSNPEKWYVGDASDSGGGWYCFEGPAVQAANGWLNHCGSGLRARSVTGLSKTELDRYAQDGIPLVVWVTLDYTQPQWSNFTWLLEDGTVYRPYRNLHCVVLAGAAGERYQVADSLAGITQVDKGLFWDSFSAMGCRAVVIE